MQADFKAVQITVVHAHQRRGKLHRSGEFGGVVRLDEHGHPQFVRQRFHFLHARQAQRGDDQQNAIRAHRARLKNLIRIDHEILAQHRQRAGGARGLQIFRRTLKVIAIGQHRQTRRAAVCIARGDIGRIEISADHALGRAGFLDLGNHCGLTVNEAAPDRTHKVARRPGVPRLRLDFG